MPLQIAPSILAADFAHLADHIARVGDEADRLHVDCMDGHYVPNLSIGPPVVQSLRAATSLYLDCHLMIANPGDLLDAFARAGADGITVHVEVGDTDSLVGRIGDLGCKVGLTFEPDTPFAAVEPWLDRIDTLLVMSVKTGFGGQPFIPAVLDKLHATPPQSTRAACRWSSRSTVASPSTLRHSQRRRASTSWLRAPRSSTSPTRTPPRPRSGRPRTRLRV